MHSEFIVVRISHDLYSAKLKFYPNKANNFLKMKYMFHPVYLE